MSNPAKNIKEAAAGAACTGSLIGLIEAVWLIQTTGAPDTLSPLYGVFLYGLLAIPFGIAAGVFWGRASRFISKLEHRAMGGGALFTLMPIAGFVCIYQIRKVVYAEQMPPLPALLGIAGGLGALGLILVALRCSAECPQHCFNSCAGVGVVSSTGPKGEDLAAVAHKNQSPRPCRKNPMSSCCSLTPCVLTMFRLMEKWTSKRQTWIHSQKTVSCLNSASLKHRGRDRVAFPYLADEFHLVTALKPRLQQLLRILCSSLKCSTTLA